MTRTPISSEAWPHPTELVLLTARLLTFTYWIYLYCSHLSAKRKNTETDTRNAAVPSNWSSGLVQEEAKLQLHRGSWKELGSALLAGTGSWITRRLLRTSTEYYWHYTAGRKGEGGRERFRKRNENESPFNRWIICAKGRKVIGQGFLNVSGQNQGPRDRTWQSKVLIRRESPKKQHSMWLWWQRKRQALEKLRHHPTHQAATEGEGKCSITIV